MTTWYDYIQSGAPSPEWPYPIRYDKETVISADVLIIGGGIAGCHAAVSAAKHGASVVVAERGNAKRSGLGGAGVDHWHACCTNPCSKVTPMDYTRAIMESSKDYCCGPARFIETNESWDTLLDLETMGVRIRDTEDEFKGADFRDDKTKLMFAYDYENRHVIRVWGYNVKPMLYKEMQRLGVKIVNRIMITSLLTEGGKQGAKVVGATGVDTRTGEFNIFKAKATIIATGSAYRLSIFAPEMAGAAGMFDLNGAGVGHAIGWKAGAELVHMEQTSPAHASGFGYAPYSVANANNTYHGTPIVDSNGKEVPWVDAFGHEINTIKGRFLPAEGQKFSLGAGVGIESYSQEYNMSDLTPTLPEKILKGEFVPPLYADLTRLPELERRVIFGMMVGNEGKTRVPVYDMYTKAGFDPDRDLLQAPILNPESYLNSCFWAGNPQTQLRWYATSGGFLMDWDLRTSLEGLYAAGGTPIFGAGCHNSASITGRYAGRRAAAYVKTAREPQINQAQLQAERATAYAPLRQSRSGIGWKELNYAIMKVLQDYCGKYKNENTLNAGLRLFKELRENEAAGAFATNPHDLGRLLECDAMISLSECILNASLSRKASDSYLGFFRYDYPEIDPPEWHKLLPIRMENDKVKSRDLPVDYHLKAPYASTYEENYKLHNGL